MATWEELNQYLVDNYEISGYGKQEQVYLLFNMPNGRKQYVMILHVEEQTTDRDWAHIESVVGEVSKVNVYAMLEILRTAPVGGLAQNDSFVTVRHAVPLASMTPYDFGAPLAGVIALADRLEQASSGLDQY